MKQSRTILALALTAVFLLANYVIGATAHRYKEPRQARDKQQNTGQFKVLYSPVKNQEYAKFQNELQKEKVLEALVADLNSTFVLPADISVTFDQCGEVNAFYNPEKRRISMCYELIENMYEIFSKHEKSEDAIDDAVIGATVFIFYHELGHALIDILDLPVTGKEEDAVDQLSTFILTDGTDEGEKAALDGARSFYLESSEQDSEIDDLPFWDEHSLDHQRFYNIICLVYGQNESKYAYLVNKSILPKERAERCSGEYTQVEKAWTRLLKPHLKK